MKKIFTLITTILFVGSMWATDPVSVTINFGTDETDWAAHTNGSYTDSDSRVWTRTFSAGNKSSGQATYSQFGNSSNACTSLVFYATAGSNISVSAFSVKMAGASGSTSPTTGTIYLYKRPAVGADVQLATASVDGTTTVECKITSAESFTSTDKLVVDYVGTAKAIRISELKYTYSAASTEPGVSVDPSPVAFGNVKQHSKGALDTEYVFKNFTVTGENLTGNITVNAPEGSIFELWNPETGSVIGTSIDLTPNANKAVEKELAIMAATGWSGAQNGSFTITGGGLAENVTVNITMNVTPTYEVAVAVNDGEMGTATINGKSAVYTDGDDVLNIVATPKPGYEFVNWTYDGDIVVLGSDDDVASNTAMASEEATITANFVAQSCSGLAAPTLGSLTKTYNSANITWTAVEHADEYIFILSEHNGEPRTPLHTSSLGTEMLNLKAYTQYDYTVMAAGDGTTYCNENNELLEGSFTTDDYPAATLTLSENGATHTFAGSHKLLDVIILPDALDDEANLVSGKVFRGWDANASCTSAPAYAPGAEYTLNAESQTLYAVFATKTGDDEPVLAQTLAYDTWSYSGTTIDKSSYRLFQSGSYIESANMADLSILAKVIVYGGTFGGDSYNSLTIGDGTNTWKNVTVSGSSEKKANTYTDGTELSGSGKLRITSNSGSGTGSQAKGVRISKVEIFTQIPISYSGYTTTGPKAAYATVSPTQITIVPEGASNTITVTTKNVDVENLSVALFNDAECTEAFDGGWLTASLDANKDIVYGAEAAVSYANARTAYIKLTAPSTDANVDPAIVVIPVEQAKKAAVFASFEDLVASDLPRTSGGTSNVKVTFENVDVQSVSSKNLYLKILDAEDTDGTKFIQIYCNTAMSESWGKGGKVSGASITGTWKLFDNAMELQVSSWEGINYTAPTFASFEELIVAELDNGQKAVVTFSNVKIHSIESEDVYIEVLDPDNNPLDIYEAPKEGWEEGGLLSGTNIECTWKEYSGGYYITLTNGWEGVTYTPTYAVTFDDPSNGTLVIKNGEDAIATGDKVAAGTTLTVTATPAEGFVIDEAIKVLKVGEDVDVTESVLSGSTLTMPAYAIKVSAAFARPYVAIMGEFNSWSGEANPLAVALDEKTASAAITLTLNENYGYGFKVLCGDNTLSIENGSDWYHLKRTWNSAPVKYISDTSNPIWIEMDMNGDYTFTWDYTDSTLTITYPALPEWEYYVGGSFTDWGTNKVKMTTTDEETWTATFELEANKTGENKYEFKIVEKQLGETWLGLQSAASMVYGNCTDWVIGGGEAAIGLETTKKANYTFTYVPATKKVSVDIPNPSPATGVDNTADETKAVKFLENGQIFILRGDKTYTIDGQLVK